MFRAMDRNRNGSLSPVEFKYAMRDYGMNFSEIEVTQIVKHFDTNKDGMLSFDEFLRAIRGSLNQRRLDMVHQAYRVLDKDGSGQVTIDDIRIAYDVSYHPDFQSGRKTADEVLSYEPPEDAIINIKPPAMNRLVELKRKRDADEPSNSGPLVLRMGVRNGGCSGLSYVMDFSTEGEIKDEDEVDVYDEPLGIKCVVDAKSLLYLYGLELDYSDELIGGGFKFFNPNAEESCGCGSSFGV